MKKSFKKSIAILLAVLMVVCTMPFAAFAADAKKPNISLKFGTFYAVAAGKTMQNYSNRNFANYAQSGLKSADLDFANGTLTLKASSAKTQQAITANGLAAMTADYTYKKGDFFTVSVLLENVSSLAATEISLKYSENIAPAGFTGTTLSTSAATYNAAFVAGDAYAAQGANALYNSETTLGEMSYVDKENRIMHTVVAAQDGSDAMDTSSTVFTDAKGATINSFTNTAVLATFVFGIVGDGAITFDLADKENADEAYYLGSIADSAQGTEGNYATYAKTDEDGSAGITFMGKNENVAATTSTVTFIDANGDTISSTEYEIGAAVTVPELPATTKDADKHYTYAWDVTPAEVAGDTDATYTIVKTAADHNWNEGVTTTEPTTEAEGVKTYTCITCGQTKTAPIDKLPPAHVHSYGEWKYNEDAVFDSASRKNGTATRTCACGDSQTKEIEGTRVLKSNGKTINLGAAITLKVQLNSGRRSAFASTYAEIEYNGQKYYCYENDKTTEIDGSNNIKFAFDKIAPENFADKVKIRLHGITEDGIDCVGPIDAIEEYSVEEYCLNTLAKPASSTLHKLLVEILYYGEADKQYRGNVVSPSPIAQLTDDQKALHDNYIPEYNIIGSSSYIKNTGTNEVVWNGATMALEGKVIPKYQFRIEKTRNLADYNFTVTVNGKPTVVNYAEHPEYFEAATTTKEGWVSFKLCVEFLDADQFRDEMLVQVTKKDGTVVSNTYRYSVESYAGSSACAANANLKNLVDQLLRYGRADAVHTGKAATYE